MHELRWSKASTRRIRQKSTAPLALIAHIGNDNCPRTRQDDCWHYGVLGISRYASAEDVRKAYKARALETHPDKGGDTKEFQRVLDAFMVLSDNKLRQAYLDKRNDDMTFSQGVSRFNSSSYCQSPVPKQRVSPEPSALQTASSSDQTVVDILLEALWDGVQNIDCLSPSTLCELYRLLQEQEGHQEVLTKESCPDSNEDGQFRCVASIRRKHNQYFVHLHCSKLNIFTRGTSCLETAIDWQMELVRLRSEAKARVANACGSNPPPLIRDEVAKAIVHMPQMRMSFRCRVSFGKQRAYSPRVRELAVALRHMDKLLAARSTRHESKTRFKKAISEVKQDAAKGSKLYARRVQSLRDALAAGMQRALGMNLARARELEFAFNEERCKSEVAIALQNALRWSKESATYATGHIRSLSPQELQQRLEHLLAPTRTDVGACKRVDLTTHRSRSRSRESCAVISYTPGRSYSRRTYGFAECKQQDGAAWIQPVIC